MQNSSSLVNVAERPSAIVCIAYRQLSMMLGVKDPTERPKLEEIVQTTKQSNAIALNNIEDLKIQFINRFSEFSKDMTESFRFYIENMKARLEQLLDKKNSMFDMSSLSNLYNWTQREQ